MGIATVTTLEPRRRFHLCRFKLLSEASESFPGVTENESSSFKNPFVLIQRRVTELGQVRFLLASNLSFLPGHRSSRSKIGGVGVPGQRQRSRTAAVAQSFCLPAHPGNGFGINASPAPFFSPGPGQFIEKVTLALQQEQNFGQTLPEFGFVFSPAAAVDNIDAEHM
uniref:HDC16444 n=1 Tax=Drosophila melanogaster TaxID=7227 RepID=Q6IIZ6_DROME|nr:TPA_inf: HDC16444 [Drosophila melanogaster]